MASLAKHVSRRQSWRGHMEGWLTALAGVVIMAAGHGRDSDAVEFFALTGLVTELQIWSLPGQAVSDWESYRKGLSHQYITDRHQGLLPSVWAIPHGLKFCWRY